MDFIVGSIRNRSIGVIAYMSPAKSTENELPFEVDDAIVLLLGSDGGSPSLSGQIKGITRLEKLIFLLQKESTLGDIFTEDPDFHAHNFGPFSSLIYQAVETLEAANLIEQKNIYSGSNEDTWETVNIVGDDAPYKSREFRLTERGLLICIQNCPGFCIENCPTQKA